MASLPGQAIPEIQQGFFLLAEKGRGQGLSSGRKAIKRGKAKIDLASVRRRE
jgi:hypothetical protein